MPPGRPTYLWAAERVLRSQRRPLNAAEIVTFAQGEGLFSDEMSSRTPQKSLQARVSTDIVRKGSGSRFVRVARGLFFLREFLDSPIEIGDTVPFPASSANLKSYVAKRREPITPAENVLTIPEAHFRKLLKFQGYRADDGSLTARLIRGPRIYMPRTFAESTFGQKQVVTYAIISHRSKILSFRRGVFSRAAEFLRGSACIGFGGHVTEDDLTLFSHSDAGLTENVVREIQEEVSVELADNEKRRFRIVGVINDDSSDVGRRHVAIVFRYEINSWKDWKNPTRGEASVNQLRWVDVNSDLVNLAEYEYWSQLCWREFFPRIAKSQPAFRILRKKPFQGRHIAIVVGGIGSGKSSVTRFLVKQYGYSEINSGQVLARLMNVPPVPTTGRAKFQQLAATYVQSPSRRKKFAKQMVEEALRISSGRVVIDGVRLRETLKDIRALSTIPVAVIFVHATPDLAYHLYCKREPGGKKKLSVSEFMKLVTAPTEQDVPRLIAEADVVVYNWLGQADLDDALNEMGRDLKIR